MNRKGPMQKTLTKRQEIIKFIDAFIKEHGYEPLIVEIADGVGLTKGAVSRHVAKMIDEGILVTDMNRSFIRNIRVAEGVLS